MKKYYILAVACAVMLALSACSFDLNDVLNNVTETSASSTEVTTTEAISVVEETTESPEVTTTSPIDYSPLMYSNSATKCMENYLTAVIENNPKMYNQIVYKAQSGEEQFDDTYQIFNDVFNDTAQKMIKDAEARAATAVVETDENGVEITTSKPVAPIPNFSVKDFTIYAEKKATVDNQTFIWVKATCNKYNQEITFETTIIKENDLYYCYQSGYVD